MFCPKCSQTIPDNGTHFCSKCGFSTKNVGDFLDKDGKISEESNISARQKGIRQGTKLILLSLILFPAFVFLNAMFPPNDVLVESSPSNTWFEQISWAILWTTFLAGVARIAFAFAFAQKSSVSEVDFEETKQINAAKINNALPPMQDTPISNFGKWKITDELLEPILVNRKTSGDLK